MRRLFVGIDIPAPIRDELLRLQSGLWGARWRPWDNLHATLRFIGDVDRHTERDIHTALSNIAAPAFETRCTGAGQFGKRRPHTLWTGLEDTGSLSHLAQKVDTAVTAAGLAPDRRKFVPHVTIAYLKGTDYLDVNGYVAEHGDFKTAPFLVDRFHLYESRMGKAASHYEKREEYLLLNSSRTVYEHEPVDELCD